MRGITLLFLIVVIPLFCKEIDINGHLSPGATDSYCLKPTKDTTLKMGIYSSKTNCITAYDSSGQLGRNCSKSSYLELQNLKKDTMYYIIKAQLKSQKSSSDYTIVFVGNNFEVGICPTQALAQVANIDPQGLSLMLTFAGLISGVLLFGSITYIILTIKEW